MDFGQAFRKITSRQHFVKIGEWPDGTPKYYRCWAENAEEAEERAFRHSHPELFPAPMGTRG